MENAFTNVYKHKIWGVAKDSSDVVTHGFGSSGDGSIYEKAKPYVDFLSDFIKQNNVKSIVDIGCGDWQFSKHLYNENEDIYMKQVDYYGYDCCKQVIEHNTEKHASENRHFKHING